MTAINKKSGAKSTPKDQYICHRTPRYCANQSKLLNQLKERVKELNALHRTASILQSPGLTRAEALAKLVSILPAAWQYPEVTAVRIICGGHAFAGRDFRKTKWMLSAEFKCSPEGRGSIEIAYLAKRPPAQESPFLTEERALLNSLAEMLESYLARKATEVQLLESRRKLQERVRERTRDLERLNRSLKKEVAERRRTEREIRKHQRQLKSLATEMSLAEERKQRAIASDLHDHIGQALAVIKMKFLQLHCNSVLCKFKDTIEDIRIHLDEAIETTRSLTFQLSPPVLYELGLVPALQWLAEEFQRKHRMTVEVTTEGQALQLSDEMRMTLFKGTRELLFNAAKHAQVSQAWVRVAWESDRIRIEVRDDGAGFDAAKAFPKDIRRSGFGLFSVKERMGYVGGSLGIESMPGRGSRATLTAPLDRNSRAKP